VAWESVQIVVVVVLVVLVFLGFLRERHPPDVVAMIAFGVLLATGILSTGEALSVFANSGPITVACMFVLSAALERTGVIEVAGGAAARLAGRSATGALVAMALCVMTVSAFINNTPVVAVLTPVAILLARTLRIAPSRLLIPLSFASIFGGSRRACQARSKPTSRPASAAVRAVRRAETAAPPPPPRSFQQHRRSKARLLRLGPSNHSPSSSACGSTARSAASNSPARGPASEVLSLVACLTFPAACLDPLDWTKETVIPRL
jgi:Citrate transporter